MTIIPKGGVTGEERRYRVAREPETVMAQQFDVPQVTVPEMVVVEFTVAGIPLHDKDWILTISDGIYAVMSDEDFNRNYIEDRDGG